jgi:hypothetical protein
LRYFDRVVSLLQNRFGKIQSGETETSESVAPLQTLCGSSLQSHVCADCVPALSRAVRGASEVQTCWFPRIRQSVLRSVNKKVKGRVSPALRALRRLLGGRFGVRLGAGLLKHQLVTVLDAVIAIEVVVAEPRRWGPQGSRRDTWPWTSWTCVSTRLRD